MREKLSATQLIKKITSSKDCPPALLITSSDEIRKTRIEKLLLDTFLPKSKVSKDQSSSLAVSRIDGRDLDTGSLRRFLDDLNTLSLFSSSRFFILHHADELNAEITKQLIAALSKPTPDSILIIESTPLPANHAFKKYFHGKEALIELEEMKENDLRRWVEKELKSVGFSEFDNEAVEALITVTEGAPDNLVKFIEQLSLYLDSSKITRTDIERLFALQTTPGEFEFIDTLTQGHAVKAEFMVQNLLASGKNPFLLLSLLSRTFASYLSIKSLLVEGFAPEMVRQRLNITPWVFNKQSSAAKSYSLDNLRHIIESILRADSKLKNRSLGAEAIFSELVFKLAATRNVQP